MDLKSFPEELITRILSYNYGNTSKIFSERKLPHVNVFQYTKEALEFAMKPGNAALLSKTIQGRLILRADTIFPQGFFDTLAPHLDELIIEGFSKDFIFRTTAQCENLRRLELKEFPSQFDWTTLPKGLKEVYVTIDSKGQMTIIGNALRRLEVQELGIRYDSTMDPGCIKVQKEVKRVCSKIAPSLKHLRKLNIEKVEYHKNSTWDIIKHFGPVEHIVITETLAKKALEMLPTKQSVTLMAAEMDIASSFGEQVTIIDVLHTSRESSLKAEDIEKLSACKNLTVFRARVLTGAEKQLQKLPTGIKELELEYTPGIKLQPGHPHHSMESLVMITPGSICNFLNGARLLSGLCIYGAQLDREEIKEVLNVLGERLLKFGVTVDTQDKSLLFAEEILNFIAQNNRNLKELNIKCEIFDEWEELGVSQEIWVEQECLQRLENCLRIFHRNVPGPQVLYLASLLRRLVRARL